MEVTICWTITSISRGFSNVKCSSDELKKKTVRAGTREKMKKFKTEESTSTISIADDREIVNNGQKKNEHEAHRKGYA